MRDQYNACDVAAAIFVIHDEKLHIDYIATRVMKSELSGLGTLIKGLMKEYSLSKASIYRYLGN